MEMSVSKAPDSLRVIDQARRIDELEEKLKLVEMAKSVIEAELDTAELENAELRRINRKYRAERQRDRESAARERLQGKSGNRERIMTGLLYATCGMAFALLVVTTIIWAIGI